VTNDRVPKLLTELKEGIDKIYGPRLKGVYLFGSYATKKQDSESDLDVLILLDCIYHYADEVDRTSDIISNLSLKYGLSISRIFLTEQDWQGDGTPFLNNARREAVAL
jgi:predicted nucleotidyltransferase